MANLLQHILGLGGHDQPGAMAPAAQGFDMSGYQEPAGVSFDPAQATGLQGAGGAMAPQHRGFFGQLLDPNSKLRHGLGDFLGNVGDAIVQSHGGQPTYRMRQQQKKLGTALSQFLGVDDALAHIAQIDPGTAATLWKAQQDHAVDMAKVNKPATTGTMSNYNFIASKLGPGAAEQYLRNLGDPIVNTTLPGNHFYSGPRSLLGDALRGHASPEPSDGAPADMPIVSDTTTYAAVPPGSHYRDPEGHIRLKPGGPTQPASGVFPGR
jgi:hypothetical protein